MTDYEELGELLAPGRPVECLPSFDVLYNETRDAWLRRFSTVDHIDSKAATVLALDGVFIGGLFAILAEGTIFQPIACTFLRLFLSLWVVLGVFSLIVSLVLALLAFWPREWTDLVEPQVVCEEQLDKPEEETRKQLLMNWIDAHNRNWTIITCKARLLKRSKAALVAAMVLFAVFIICYVVVLAVGGV